MELLAGLCGCGGALLGLFVPALILRAAVALANRIVVQPKADDSDEWGNWDDWDSDEPATPRRKKKAIPEPGILKGMVIIFATTLVTIVVGFVLTVIIETEFPGLDEELEVIVLAVLTLPVSFLTLSFLLTRLLPTRFGYAVLSAFLYYLFVFIILVGAAVIVWGFFAAAGL